VTGAGGGIGRAVALALGEAGADVTLFGRREAALRETAELAGARGGGGRVRVVAGDVAHAEAVERAVRDGTVGSPIDLLVTCAGVNYPGPLVDAPDEKLSEMLTTNVLGTLVACRAVARRLLGVGRPGAIVCISSQMGSVGYPGRAPYCASKHAVNGLVKALALEWAAHPIRVNAVAPTFVETPLTASMLADAAFRRDVLARIPLGRVGTVEEVAGAVLYLLSDEASLITGHVLAVDGGWTAI
jgi:NAD(P)-dependent dehydrogenase (short-subunit alcohol dehydrogenase family)